MPTDKPAVYLAISKSNRTHLDPELETLKTCLERHGFDLLIFVDKYNFTTEQEKEMMATAFAEIDKSVWVIAEVSKKAIGVGVEVGYAKAKGKPILYLKKEGSSHSTTVGGTADDKIEYHDTKNLRDKLLAYLYNM